MSLNEEQSKLIEEMRLKLIAIEMRLNTLEAIVADDETYQMEQNERRG